MDENQALPSAAPSTQSGVGSNEQSTPPVPPTPEVSDKDLSDKPGSGKTIATILLLIFFWPIGLILMFVWMKWPTWVKTALTILLVLINLILVPIIFITAVAAIIAINPEETQNRAYDSSRIQSLYLIDVALDEYYSSNGSYPSTLFELAPEYLNQVPKDPDGSNMDYTVDQGGQDFMLCTQYESELNVDVPECVNAAGPIE